MVIKESTKSTPALKRSGMDIAFTSNELRKAVDRTWAAAATSPFLTKKIPKRKGADGIVKKASRRSNRVFSNHTIKTILSGASARAAAILSAESKDLRLKGQTEHDKYPYMVAMSKGALLLLEQAVSAAAAEAFETAVNVKNGMSKKTKHSKVSNKAMQIGADALNRKFSVASGFHTSGFVSRMPQKKPESSKAKEARKLAKAAAKPMPALEKP